MLSVGMLLKKSLKGELDLMGVVMKLVEEITKGKVSKSENNESILNEELTILKNLKNVFLIIAGSAFQKYGSEFQKHQQSLLGLSDMLIEIYFAESALLRTIKNNDRGHEISYQSDMSKLYLFEATDLIQKKAKEIIGNISKGEAKKTLLKGIHRLCRYEDLPDIISLKNKIAEKVISENKYCF
tara:strand:- start:33 stop:584 length:552 start_codon:yes stop_codon:yes gene_type:complete